MKNYNLGFYIVVLIVLISGCDNILQEDPPSSVTVDEFYQSEQEARLALDGVYAVFWSAGMYRDAEFPFIIGGLSGEALEGYEQSGENSEPDTFTLTSSFSALSELWEYSYLGINRANQILARLPDTQIETSAKNNISGQTKFLRALIYFHLVETFGGVPIYLEPTTNESASFTARSSVQEVYNTIVADLQDSEEELASFNESDQDQGRATLGSAKALLAKVYLQKKDWEQAANKAKEVMDMGVYGLFANYADTYNQAAENGKEHIFSIQYLDAQGQSSLASNHLPEIPDVNLLDGTGATFSLNIDMNTPQYKIEDSFFENWPDTYRKWSSARGKMPFYYDKSSSQLVEDTVALPKPISVKFYDIDRSNGTLRTGTNYPVIRYADILLIYAEAENEINGGPTPEAYEAINKVRRRARGVGTIHEQPESLLPDLEGLIYEEFRMALLNERGKEFVMEGQRRWDLLRFDKLIEVNNANGKNAAERDTLFPIPEFEIRKNTELEQNPGWE